MAGPRVTGPRLMWQINRAYSVTQRRSLHLTGVKRAPRVPAPVQPVQIRPHTEIAGSEPAAAPERRLFNTTRSLKAVNDSSTIDFAYLPRFDLPELSHNIESQAPSWQIPILPSATHRYDATTSSPHDLEILRARRDADVTSPEAADASSAHAVIVTAACESTHINAPSAMSDVHDGAEHHATDFHEVSEVLSSGRGKVSETLGSSIEAVRDAARMVATGLEREGQDLKQSKGLLKQIWTGLMDDLTGGSKAQTGKS